MLDKDLGVTKPGEPIDLEPNTLRLYQNPWTPNLSEAQRKNYAEQDFERKWNALGGAPGAPATPGEAGVQILDNNFIHAYTHGSLYYSPHYKDPVYVGGGIGEKYLQLGGPRSWLGWPLANPENPWGKEKDEQPVDEEGGIFSTFQNGAIYWWPDTGAIDLNNVSVRYKGLTCFAETDEVSNSDEPYVIFGILPSPPAQPSSVLTKVYEDFDAGESRKDDIELYRGPPYGLVLSVLLMEQDQGDPNKYRGLVQTGVTQAGNGLASAALAVPGVGIPLAAAVKLLFEEFGGDLTDLINNLLGTANDVIVNFPWKITPKQLVTSTQVGRKTFRGIEHHLESEILSDKVAAYKIYLDITGV